MSAELKELIEIIHQIKHTKKLTQEAIAEQLGYDRTYLSQLLNGKKEVSKKLLDKVKMTFPELATEQTPQQTFLEKRRASKIKSDPYLVPFVTVKAQAGYVKAVDQELYLDTLEKYALPPMVDPRGAIWRYWEIEGDSMEPVFHTGDIILTSMVHQYDWQNLRNFYTYVIVTRDEHGNGSVLIKRIFCKNDLEWVLISDNEANYEQQLLPVEYVKEVWVYRKTWKTDASPGKVFEIKV